MQFLDLTLDSPAENIALDEALLEEAEQCNHSREVFRIWESPQWMVVIGRSSRVASEIDLDSCRRDDVPVLRRGSGGTAIVAGPGCLMYALILSYELRPQLRSIDTAHQFVLNPLAANLAELLPGIHREGLSDLVTGDKLKFSGNSMRCRRKYLLYHGTILCDFPLRRISRYLATPPRQPEYRKGRDHESFVTNLNIPRDEVRAALLRTWKTSGDLKYWPRESTDKLVAEKYSQDSWNRRI